MAHDALLRYLAQHRDQTLRLAELPGSLIDADTLTVLDGDGLIEIGHYDTKAIMHRGECVEGTPEWHRTPTADPGYEPLESYLAEIVSAGWQIRLTSRGRIEAARLRLAAVGDQDDQVVKPERTKQPAKTKPRRRKWDHVWQLVVKHNAQDGIGMDHTIAKEHNKLCAAKIETGKCQRIDADKVAQIRYEYKNPDRHSK